MFEIGIISIVVLAVGYWVTLWLMGRHDDVLHGDFVHPEDGIEAPALPGPRFAARPPFPAKPVIKPPAIKRPPAGDRSGAAPAAAEPAAAGTSSTASASSAPPSRADRTDTLRSLLA